MRRFQPALRLFRHLVAAACLLEAGEARAVDPFEIQVYDANINPPGAPGIELHVNSVFSGVTSSLPPELPANHQTHFTAEPSVGVTAWWELGGYLQSTLRGDGGFDYAGVKLRSKFVWPTAAADRLHWAVNFEVSRLPETYDRDRWGAEIRPIGTTTAAGARLYFAFNPILDLSLAGSAAARAPALEPAATALYKVAELFSAGLEYYANFGPIGSWLPASLQEHYLFEVVNLSKWRRWEINLGVGEGLTGASNRFVGKMILGFR